MAQLRFVMIGGFLGAGKTTLIAALARRYTEQGLRIGIVTNDQAYGLVDTHSLRTQGFDVGEVPGACFCCKFDDLVDTTRHLASDNRPDVILTEPVGSCTDLVATVIEPLRHFHQDDYQIAPYVVLCKPEHGLKILGDANVGFSPKAAYVFKKQLEEADAIAIAKVDKLGEDERTRLARLIHGHYPDTRQLSVSAKTGEGMDDLVALLEAEWATPRRRIDVDYDVYAEGEAELGWLNATVQIETAGPSLSLDAAVSRLVARLSELLHELGYEPAHLKVFGNSDADPTSYAVANLVDSDGPPELSLASEIRVPAARLLVNARVAGSPEKLATLVDQAVADLETELRAVCTISDRQFFRPGRPTPTHRLRATEP